MSLHIAAEDDSSIESFREKVAAADENALSVWDFGTPLLRAIEARRLDKARVLLDRMPSLAYTSSNPLLYVTQKLRYKGGTQLLLPYCPESHVATALRKAAERADWELIGVLAERYFSTDWDKEYGVQDLMFDVIEASALETVGIYVVSDDEWANVSDDERVARSVSVVLQQAFYVAQRSNVNVAGGGLVCQSIVTNAALHNRVAALRFLLDFWGHHLAWLPTMPGDNKILLPLSYTTPPYTGARELLRHPFSDAFLPAVLSFIKEEGALELIAPTIAANPTLFVENHTRFPPNCPGILAAMPYFKDPDHLRLLVRLATPADQARLHYVLLCLCRAFPLSPLIQRTIATLFFGENFDPLPPAPIEEIVIDD